MSTVLEFPAETRTEEKKILGFFVGKKFESEGRVYTDQFPTFGNLTRDNNNIHRDIVVARKNNFSHIPAQGMLIASLAVGILTEHLPDGVAFRGLDGFKMRKPVFQFNDLVFLYEIDQIKKPLVFFKFSVCDKANRGIVFAEGRVFGILPRI